MANNVLCALTVALLGQALVAQAGPFSKHKEQPGAGNDIEALCAGKDIDLSTLEQLRELAAKVEDSRCSAMTKDAIVKLVETIEPYKEDACKMGAAKEFWRYHESFLDTNGINKFLVREIAEPVARFAVAYGLKLSALCREAVVDKLTRETPEQLVGEKYANLFDTLTSGEGPVDHVLGFLGSRDEVFLPQDITSFGAEMREIRGERTRLRPTTPPMIKKIQGACLRHFSPVYRPLVMPTVALANIGFDYKTRELEDKLAANNYELANRVGRWSRIMFLCESLTHSHLEEAPEYSDKKREEEGTLVSITIESAWPHEFVPYSNSLVQVAIDSKMAIYDRNDQRLAEKLRSLDLSRSSDQVISERVWNTVSLMKRKKLRGGAVVEAVKEAKEGYRFVHPPAEHLIVTLDRSS